MRTNSILGKALVLFSFFVSANLKTTAQVTTGTISILQVTNDCSPRQGTLKLTGYVGSIQMWEYSIDQQYWTKVISPENTYDFSITQTTYYRVQVTSNGSSAYCPVFTLNMSSMPSAPLTTGASRCGAGSVTLSATGTGNLKWYSDAGLSNLVAVGGSYSPSLTTSTTYYVTATNAAGCASNATT